MLPSKNHHKEPAVPPQKASIVMMHKQCHIFSIQLKKRNEIRCNHYPQNPSQKKSQRFLYAHKLTKGRVKVLYALSQHGHTDGDIKLTFLLSTAVGPLLDTLFRVKTTISL